MNIPMAKLGNLCAIDRQGAQASDPEASELTYIGVEHVTSGSGALDFSTGSRVGDGKSTSFRFDERHVLYAKLRPYLNKVAVPDFAGKCSTELVPLLPKEGVDREYLAFLLRRQATVDWVMSSVTGARMPRTDMKVLMAMPAPRPSLEEQRRIVDILNRAARIESLRARASNQLRALIPALFIKMFGDDRQISERFDTRPLKEVASIGSGATKGRKIDPQAAVEVPYLRVANVQDGFLNLDEIKTIVIRGGEEQKYALEPGDLVMTEGGDPDKLGRAAIWTGQLEYCAHQNHIFRVRPNTEYVLSDYLRAAVGSTYGKAYFLRVAKQTTGIASINKTQLGDFPVPVPPIDLQERYSALVERINGTDFLLDRSAEEAHALSQALMSQVFDPEPPQQDSKGSLEPQLVEASAAQ